MEEVRMSSENQVSKILNEGEVKDLIKNPMFLTRLIASNDDRHILGALLNLVNNGIENGEITDEDLELLRSGFLTEQILDLEKIRFRSLFPFEIGDKLNYISTIHDIETLNASYTNDRLIEKINSQPNSEIKYWIDSGTFYTLPNETKLQVIKKFFETGNTDLTKKLLDIAAYYMENKRKSGYESIATSSKNR